MKINIVSGVRLNYSPYNVDNQQHPKIQYRPSDNNISMKGWFDCLAFWRKKPSRPYQKPLPPQISLPARKLGNEANSNNVSPSDDPNSRAKWGLLRFLTRIFFG